jgi:hypothetical protein
MRLYHGTKEHHLESFQRGLQVGHPDGDFGPRFYLTPILEVAVWFAFFWTDRPTRRDKQTGLSKAALLVFDLPWQDYADLCWNSRVEPPLRAGVSRPQARGAAPPASARTHELIIGPISGDWQHLANGVQYAVSVRGLARFKPEIVGLAIEGAWRQSHPGFDRLFPYEDWGVETTVLRDPG